MADYQFGAWPILSKRTKSFDDDNVAIVDVYDMKHILIFDIPDAIQAEVNELVVVKEDDNYVEKIELNKYFTVESVRKYLKELEFNILKELNKVDPRVKPEDDANGGYGQRLEVFRLTFFYT